MAAPAGHVPGLTALILAGERPGGDRLAHALGVEAKALIEVGGVPMLARVIAALRATPGIGRIVVAAQRAEAMLARLDNDTRCGPIAVQAFEAAATPSLTVAAAFDAWGGPLLVTTADHALLTDAMVRAFLAGLPAGVDAAAAVARAETVRAELPRTARTWMRFREADYSGCNLFWLGAGARPAIAFWRRLEQHRKRPLRMALLAGPVTLALYAARRATLAGTLDRLGRRAGARLAAVELPFARAAVDVDKLADLDLVRSLLHAA